MSWDHEWKQIIFSDEKETLMAQMTTDTVGATWGNNQKFLQLANERRLHNVLERLLKMDRVIYSEIQDICTLKNIKLCCMIISYRLSLYCVVLSDCYSRIMIFAMHLNLPRNDFKKKNTMFCYGSIEVQISTQRNLWDTLSCRFYTNKKRLSSANEMEVAIVRE